MVFKNTLLVGLLLTLDLKKNCVFVYFFIIYFFEFKKILSHQIFKMY